MTVAQPKITIITATYRARGLLNRAIGSCLLQTNPHWEMIIAPDDGQDYSHLERMDSRIRVVKDHPGATGPGPARNRALALARGEFIAMLDDDDVFEIDFVGKVSEYLQTVPQVILPTEYVTEWGQSIRAIGAQLSRVSITDYAQQLGSMQVVSHRDNFPQWTNGFAEDVIHTCLSIDRAGGTVQVAQGTRYVCMVRSASLCATRKDINDEYRKAILREYPDMTPSGQAQTKALFRLRLAVSESFEQREDKSLGYHEFVKRIAMQNQHQHQHHALAARQGVQPIEPLLHPLA